MSRKTFTLANKSSYLSAALAVFGLAFFVSLLIPGKVSAISKPLDTLFGSQGKVFINVLAYETGSYAVALQPDGKIIVVGSSNAGAFQGDQFYVARFKADGTYDTTFGTGGVVVGQFGDPVTPDEYISSRAQAVAVQPDGKIVVAGDFHKGSLIRRNFAVARFNPNGSLDTTFDGDGHRDIAIGPQHDMVRGMVMQPDGKILLYGTVGNGSSEYYPALARFNTDGSSDNSFGTGGTISYQSDIYGMPNALLLKPDGKLMMITSVWGYGSNDVMLVSLKPGGQADTTFGAGNGRALTRFGPYLAGIASAVLLPDGKITMVSTGGPSSNNTDALLYRVNADGTPDNAFGTNGLKTIVIGPAQDGANRILLQTDGKYILVGSRRLSGNGVGNEIVVIRANADGNPDPTFGANGIANVSFTSGGANETQGIYGAVQAPSGQIVLSGISQRRGILTRFKGDVTLADFDGDSRSDISLWRPSEGNWYLSRSTGGFSTANWGVATDIPIAADFTGDGKTDYSVFRPSEGKWYILRSENGTYFTVDFGGPGDKPVPADYDGDGLVDAGVFRPSTGTWYIVKTSESGAAYSIPFGQAGDIPLAGDYDGGGSDDIAVYRPTNGTWYRYSLNDNQYYTTQFGANGDIAAPADFDGDSKVDIAVFRPATGLWYVLNSSAGAQVISWGQNGDIPVAADYDGDGYSDIAVFRAGTWYIREHDGDVVITQFGQSGDIPIASR